MTLALAAGGAGAQPPAQAPQYPTRPIRLIVPFTPGGGTDILARVVAESMSRRLPQAVVVENHAGGNTLIATELLAKAEPDGYTLLMQTNNLAVNPTLYKHLDFDTLKDLAPVSLVARNPHVLVVNPKVPARSFAEFITYAKAHPGQMHFASAGSGTVNHLTGELLKMQSGIDIVHVPYRGSGSVMPDLLAGRVEMQFAALPVVSGYIRDGRLRALAVTTRERFKGLPEVPTIAESGYPDYDFSSWFGILAPAGTPAPVIGLLSAQVGQALADPKVIERLSDYELIGSTPQAFGDFLRAEITRSADIVKRSGASID
ncbi:hypothetical protein AD428_06075 [Achromobacter sp. DMS1]|nr:hypothetical protein AD428_06075 [Achromobacter sp. DMS1]